MNNAGFILPIIKNTGDHKKFKINCVTKMVIAKGFNEEFVARTIKNEIAISRYKIGQTI